jgi:DNA repair protein RadA/Sms
MRWVGKCPDCGEWNTLVEEVVEERSSGSLSNVRTYNVTPQRLAEIRIDETSRLPLPIGEFSRVLGGGIVPGSLVLIGGEPGVGKSTLLLQAAVETARQIGPTLYVSGEESAQQIKMRADRLGVGNSELYLLTETNLDTVLNSIETMKPKLAIVDSIQTTYLDTLQSSPGTVTQVRECAQRLQAAAKSSNVAVFIVGHVTKEGTIAGPKVLEHIVDTVLQLEGDRFHAFRMLRSMKNRFGATSEVGVFEMAGDGMKEVTNPSEAFLAERMMHAPGSAVAVTMEGTRPLLVEVQALTSTTQNPMPRRTANGFDYNRLFLLIAVLGKRVGVRLHDQDVFVNVVGGMTIDEPAADLAAAVAIASANKGIPVPPDMAIIGEVGLSGEIRSVSQLNQRLNEAAKLGFARCILPKTTRKIEQPHAGLQLLPVRSLGEALDAALSAH